jgi:RNA polymerase sigma-70 factor (ECF subfamily)
MRSLGPVDENAHLAWIARNILPLEGDVRRWLMRHVRGLERCDVDDIIQEAYAKLLATQLPEIVNPRAFFLTVAKNLVLEQARRARVVPMERLGDVEALRILADIPGPERQVSAREELERLLTAAESLPRQARRVFEMRKLLGLSQRDVAERLGISQRTVEHNLARALAQILDRLAEMEGTRDAECVSEPMGVLRESVP